MPKDFWSFGGDDDDVPPMSAEEAAAAFAHQVTPETYVGIHDEVLRSWNYRCAITGMQFAPSQRPHPDLEIIAIRPLSAGGPLTAANFLPLVGAAARAFERGHIIVGEDFEMWASLIHTDPELLESIAPLGRLTVPDAPEQWPDRVQLRWHREQVLAPRTESA